MNIHTSAMAAIAAVLSTAVGAASAGTLTIAGPTLTTYDASYQITGLEFVANQNSVLTGFTFTNQGLADTIELLDSAGNVVDSISTPAGQGTVSPTVSWALSMSSSYYLVQTTYNNGYYAYFGQPLPTNANVSITASGVFSQTASVLGAVIHGDQYWADFNNITTSASAPVPVPAAAWLLLSGLGGLGLMARKPRAA